MSRKLTVFAALFLFIGAGKLSAQRPEIVPNHYFVGFRGPVSAGDRAALASQGAAVTNAFAEIRALEVVVRNNAQLNAIQRNPNVEYVEAVPMRYPVSLGDSQATPSWNNGLYGLITTKAAEVHSRGVTGYGINVGVADTGIDYNQPDIQANYKGGIDTVGAGDNDPFWNNDANETHGTHVAGTIIAATNSVGIVGVAYSANLFHARVLGPNGGSTTDIMEGVKWLVESANCKVVNLSLGGSFRSKTEENFYDSMRRKGALIVAASGNDSASKLSFPAGYASNISVGAVDRNNVVADFSNRGRGLDVVAPGVLVLSSVPQNSGSEASVNAGAAFQAFGMEFAGKTAGSGIAKILVNCGLGQPSEFPLFAAGNIAVIQRGAISFADKVTNAMNAGAFAVIIYNNVAGDFSGTLGDATTADGRNWIPAVSVSDASGAALQSQISKTGTVVNIVTSWDHYSGTSMATPHVTGVIALIWSANPSLRNSDVENYLFTTATDLGAAGYDTTYGYGIVNASAAVAKAGK
jgi:subtilisin family serine protease